MTAPSSSPDKQERSETPSTDRDQGNAAPYDQAALDYASREVHMMLLREGSSWGTKACEEMGRVFMTAYLKAQRPSLAASDVREALRLLYEQVNSLDSYTLTRDLDRHEAEACWDGALDEARKALSTSVSPLAPFEHCVKCFTIEVCREKNICLTGGKIASESDDLVLTDWKARFHEEHAIVNRCWKALGISTYEGAGGKAIDEIIRERCAVSHTATTDYIGFARYEDYNGRRATTLDFCDSDTPGAFKVYRAPVSHTAPKIDPTYYGPYHENEFLAKAHASRSSTAPNSTAREFAEFLADCLPFVEAGPAENYARREVDVQIWDTTDKMGGETVDDSPSFTLNPTEIKALIAALSATATTGKPE